MCLFGSETSCQLLNDASREGSGSRPWVTVPPSSSPTHLLKAPPGIQLTVPRSCPSRSTLGSLGLTNAPARNTSHEYSRRILGTRWAYSLFFKCHRVRKKPLPLDLLLPLPGPRHQLSAYLEAFLTHRLQWQPSLPSIFPYSSSGCCHPLCSLAVSPHCSARSVRARLYWRLCAAGRQCGLRKIWLLDS